MVRKITYYIFLGVLILCTFLIFTKSPKDFVQDRPPKGIESVKLNNPHAPVSYVEVASYEANFQGF